MQNEVEFIEQLKQQMPATSRQGTWARDYAHRRPPCQKAPATSALLTGVTIIGGIYFVGFWLVPFVKALLAAAK